MPRTLAIFASPPMSALSSRPQKQIQVLSREASNQHRGQAILPMQVLSPTLQQDVPFSLCLFGVELCPPKNYVEVLTPSTSDCDLL